MTNHLFDSTHAPRSISVLTSSLSWSRCLEYVLEEIEHSRKANIMVATHNEDTVKFTLEK